MCESWRVDPEKYTFIIAVVDRLDLSLRGVVPSSVVEETVPSSASSSSSELSKITSSTTSSTTPPFTSTLVESYSLGEKGTMVGDVNLFLSNFDPDEHKDYESGDEEVDGDGDRDRGGGHGDREGDGETGGEGRRRGALQAELEIMVAAKTHRRKNVGTRSILAMLDYGIDVLGVKRFFVKIKDGNIASLR